MMEMVNLLYSNKSKLGMLNRGFIISANDFRLKINQGTNELMVFSPDRFRWVYTEIFLYSSVFYDKEGNRL